MPAAKMPRHSASNIQHSIVSLSNRDGVFDAAPALSRRLHREASADAADPVATLSADFLLLPKEGGQVPDSRKPGTDGGVLSLVR